MGETLRLALDSLRAHKLRSFLTLLGVILAVTTLVAVMSVVAGLNFYVADRVAKSGLDLLSNTPDIEVVDVAGKPAELDKAIAEMNRARYHNHRGVEHSDIVSNAIFDDLARTCEVFRRDVENRVIVKRLNVGAPGGFGK